MNQYGSKGRIEPVSVVCVGCCERQLKVLVTGGASDRKYSRETVMKKPKIGSQICLRSQ